MFKFLHAADIHLDSPLKGLERYEGAPAADLREATRRALLNLVQLAIEEQVAFVLVAGDLYDGDWRDYNTGLFFVKQMARLREADIPAYLIAGNHDAQSKMTRTLRMPDNVRWLSADEPETVLVDRQGVALHGQGFKTQAVTRDLSAAYPNAVPGALNIGLLHTCAAGKPGHENYAPCSLDGLLAKGYDYWALGHVHKREVLHQAPNIAFPGNTQGRHILETGAKGCLLVTVGDNHEMTPEFRPLDVVRWERCAVDASEAQVAADVLDLLQERLGDLLGKSDGRAVAVRVTVDGPCPGHAALAASPERFTQEVRAAAIDYGAGRLWIEKVKLRTSLPTADDLLDDTEGPIGELLQLLADLNTDEVLQSDIAEELDDLRRKLPPELREGPDALDLKYADGLREIVHHVRPMLLARLRREEGAP